jgi:hypothetical protein
MKVFLHAAKAESTNLGLSTTVRGSTAFGASAGCEGY